MDAGLFISSNSEVSFENSEVLSFTFEPTQRWAEIECVGRHSPPCRAESSSDFQKSRDSGLGTQGKSLQGPWAQTSSVTPGTEKHVLSVSSKWEKPGCGADCRVRKEGRWEILNSNAKTQTYKNIDSVVHGRVPWAGLGLTTQGHKDVVPECGTVWWDQPNKHGIQPFSSPSPPRTSQQSPVRGTEERHFSSRRLYQ